MGGLNDHDADVLRQQVELEMELKFLKEKTELQGNQIEEMYAMMQSMNETILKLDHTIESVAKPLNNDIRTLKEFSNEFNNLKFKVWGGLIVLSVIIGSLWGLFSPIISKLLSKSIG